MGADGMVVLRVVVPRAPPAPRHDGGSQAPSGLLPTQWPLHTSHVRGGGRQARLGLVG